MTKQEIENYSQSVIEDYGLDALGWSFRWNTRMVRAVGKCRLRSRKFSKTIELSHKWFVDLGVSYEGINEELIKDTLLHEVAHALDYEERGTSDHGPRWKNWAINVGADPQRTCDLPHHLEALMAKWVKVCPNCDSKRYYHRKPSKTTACYDCCERYNGGSYTDEFKRELKRNPEKVF